MGSVSRNGLLNDLTNVNRSPLQIEPSLLYFGDVQDVIDQAGETIGLFIDNVQKFDLLIHISIGLLQKDFSIGLDRG